MIPIKPFPWLTVQAVQFLDQFLSDHPHARILECGVGGSTIWFAQRTKQLISLEHSLIWFNKVQHELASRFDCHSVTMILRKKPYDIVLDNFSDNFFDLVLIDGNNRMACVRKSERILKPGGILMLDDAQRQQYAPIFEEFSHWPMIKTVQYGNNLYVKPGEELVEAWTCWWIKPF
jgi:predicted O-methyltransferase YrrM